MSTINGNNPVTGESTAVAEVTQEAMVAAKAVLAAEAKLADDRAAAKKRVIATAKLADKGIGAFCEALCVAFELSVHEYDTDANGKPFTSFPAWVSAQVDGLEHLGTVIRRGVVDTLHKHGMSVRAIAAATNVGKSTVQDDIDKARQAEQSDAEQGTDETAEVDAETALKQIRQGIKRLTKSFDSVCTKVSESDLLISATTEELETLLTLAESVANTMRGTLALQAQLVTPAHPAPAAAAAEEVVAS